MPQDPSRRLVTESAFARARHNLSVGQATFDMMHATSSNAITTQVLRLTHFRAVRTEQISTIVYTTGGTGAGATPTTIKYGIYSVASDGALTLLMSTLNDTTLLAATNTQYSKVLQVPVTLVNGVRYAVGLLVVTGATAPSILGLPSCPVSAIWFPADVRVASRVTATVTDHPATVTNAAQSASGIADYVELWA